MRSWLAARPALSGPVFALQTGGGTISTGGGDVYTQGGGLVMDQGSIFTQGVAAMGDVMANTIMVSRRAPPALGSQ